MTKLQLNKDIFYLDLSSTPNVDIVGITVFMWGKMILKPSSLLIML